MQNSNPKDIDTNLKDLSEIKLPKRIDYNTVFFTLMMIAFESWFIYSQDWIQASLCAVVVIVYIARAVWVFRANTKTLKLIKLLRKFNETLKEINNTPVLREEGKSVIFTFLSPSPKLMKELEKFKNE